VKRLLIVEDNALVVQLLSQLLEEHYTLDVASNGKLGVEAALAHQPDLILMDLTMPVMDGWAAIRTLRAEDRAHPDHRAQRLRRLPRRRSRNGGRRRRSPRQAAR
jgi:CheY-like chemotaxis protein